MGGAVGPRAGQQAGRRAFWLKHLHQWHWVSSAACLIGMLLFAVTGITLNHAGEIAATPVVTTASGEAPAPLRSEILRAPRDRKDVPPGLARWAAEHMRVDIAAGQAEWNDPELYVSLPRAGGDAWFSIDLDSGEARYELTDRGWISYLNDLHKGRNTGTAWKWFLDLFAVACVVFTITGLFLLQLHAGNRPATWPMVALGLVVPLLLAILFIH